MGERTRNVKPGDIGATLDALWKVIENRRDACPDESYTARLLQGNPDEPLKKVVEEACEVVLACKDRDHDHIRYEAADLVYHLLVVLAGHGVSIEELAGELDARAR
ncbi:MAG: phosphoribosyl-ATP diphosphatase [Slackia sp.]|nr:phosphoribosyl-ATP diphosphatase [Slackia sp.]